jgi:hypothetical protein
MHCPSDQWDVEHIQHVPMHETNHHDSVVQCVLRGGGGAGGQRVRGAREQHQLHEHVCKQRGTTDNVHAGTEPLPDDIRGNGSSRDVLDRRHNRDMHQGTDDVLRCECAGERAQGARVHCPSDQWDMEQHVQCVPMHEGCKQLQHGRVNVSIAVSFFGKRFRERKRKRKRKRLREWQWQWQWQWQYFPFTCQWFRKTITFTDFLGSPFSTHDGVFHSPRLWDLCSLLN